MPMPSAEQDRAMECAKGCVNCLTCQRISPEDPVDGALDVVVRLLEGLDALLRRHPHRLQHRQAVGVRHKAGRGGGTTRGTAVKM